jgi:hypothetical protein
MTASYMPVAERLLNIGKCGAAKLLSQLPVGDPVNMAVSWRQVDGDENGRAEVPARADRVRVRALRIKN